MTLTQLPTLNAILNATSALLLVGGFLAIRRRHIQVHLMCMLSACVTSAVFLTSYLIYHAQVGSVRFPGHGLARRVYLSILITHTILAIAIVPLVLRTLFLALRRRFIEHRRLAHWTWPLWLYVSVTGVIIYWMLYRMEWTT